MTTAEVNHEKVRDEVVNGIAKTAWAASPSVGRITGALAKAHAEFKPIKKTKTAVIPTQKGTFTYSYADLADVIDATRSGLSAHGLVVTQLVAQRQLCTKLLHESGEFFESSIDMPTFARPQELGSWLTYVRRYMRSAILDIASEEDDDGQSANASESKPNARKGKPEPKPPVPPDNEPADEPPPKKPTFDECLAAVPAMDTVPKCNEAVRRVRQRTDLTEQQREWLETKLLEQKGKCLSAQTPKAEPPTSEQPEFVVNMLKCIDMAVKDGQPPDGIGTVADWFAQLESDCNYAETEPEPFKETVAGHYFMRRLKLCEHAKDLKALTQYKGTVKGVAFGDEWKDKLVTEEEETRQRLQVK